MKKTHKPLLKLSSLVLTLSWIIAWLVLAFYLISCVLPLLSSPGGQFVNALPIHFEVTPPAEDPNVEIITDSPATILNIPQADGLISFQSSDIRLQLLAIGGVLLSATATLFILFQLRKIVGKIQKGKPFMEENLGRIRKIAYGILAYQLLNGLYGFITSSIVATEFRTDIYMPSVTVEPTWEFFNLSVIGFVLVILVIEHAFREGLELQQEKDLTI